MISSFDMLVVAVVISLYALEFKLILGPRQLSTVRVYYLFI